MLYVSNPQNLWKVSARPVDIYLAGRRRRGYLRYEQVSVEPPKSDDLAVQLLS